MSYNINYQVASYKLLLNKSPPGNYLFRKDEKMLLQNILINNHTSDYSNYSGQPPFRRAPL